MAMLELVKKFVRSNEAIGSIAVPLYMNTLYKPLVRRKAKAHGLTVTFDGNRVQIGDKSRQIVIRRDQEMYIIDMIANFEYFHAAVKATKVGDVDVVDFTTPKFHDVIGYDLHPIFFPSIAETYSTTSHYSDFAVLEEGSVVIDLGAYSGLTSIVFRQECGESGRVIAVEADAQNIDAIKKNFELYKKATGRDIDLVEGAIWVHSNGISFSTEGSVSSSATDIVGNRMGASRLVRSYTLSDLVKLYNLDRVDYIKCDVEGAEKVVFDDAEFFKKFKPRIIAEVHPVDGVMTTEAVRKSLAPHGYTFKLIDQSDFYLPLLECSPPA